MTDVMNEYYKSVALFEYEQILENLEESESSVDSVQMNIKHNNTVYNYDFLKKELMVIDKNGRIDYILERDEVIKILKQELPHDKYYLFEKALFNLV